jgi:hypothetical protein
MDNRVLLVIVLSMVLLFGCLGQQPAKPAGAANGTGQAGVSGNNGSPSGSGTQDDGTGTAGSDLANKGLQELVALGGPVECTMVFKNAADAPGFKSATLYMKGQQFKEIIETEQGGKTFTVTVIRPTGDWVYTEYSDPNMLAAYGTAASSCKGFKMPLASNDTSSASVPNPSDVSAMDKLNLDCKVGLFGDEMFAVSGNYCSIADLVKAATGGKSPEELCGQLTDPEQKASCIQALSGQ